MKSKAIMTLIILLLASSICLGVLSCGSDSTPVLTPLPGPVPSDTKIPSEPTDVPQDINEGAHRDDMAVIATELSTKVYDLDRLLASPEWENVDWVSKVTLTLENITTLCDAAYKIVPLDSMTDVQATFLEAINHVDDAVDLLVRGIDEEDIDLINQASAEMWLATEILAQVIGLSE